MARSRLSAAATDESVEIIAFYADLLERTVPPPDLVWEPVRIGPTWQWDNGWVLPSHTLGWDMLAWCGQWLRAKTGGPWVFTAEQARFLLWFYGLDDTGAFLFHSAVLQRLKGWGKDPTAACVSCAGMFAPITFDHWDGDRPVGRDEPDAWIQLVAASQTQTQNTMKLFPSLISPAARKQYAIQIQKLSVWGMSDARQIEAVTSSPLVIEGGRPTLIIRNEPQNWNASNGGHEMAGAIEGNAAKSPDGAARILDICNAYRPGGDSVGQRTREAWQATQGDVDAPDDADRPQTADFGLMYDSLEAPPDAPLTAEDAPSVIEAIRGDAVWLNTRRIVKSILNPSNSASESRRKWYNQVVSAEDSWVDLAQFDQLADKTQTLGSSDDLGVFFDGSKSDDATGIMGCRISDGFVFTLGMWQRPPGYRGRDWTVPRGRVDARMDEIFAQYPVVALFADPSHTRDDETQERYWDDVVDGWHRRFGARLKVKATRDHAVLWDMSSPQRSAEFTAAAERCAKDIEDAAFGHDGDPRLRLHVQNAKGAPNRWGRSLMKDNRESARKIDLAVCMVGARMVRRLVLNKVTERRGGKVMI